MYQLTVWFTALTLRHEPRSMTSCATAPPQPTTAAAAVRQHSGGSRTVKGPRLRTDLKDLQAMVCHHEHFQLGQPVDAQNNRAAALDLHGKRKAVGDAHKLLQYGATERLGAPRRRGLAASPARSPPPPRRAVGDAPPTEVTAALPRSCGPQRARRLARCRGCRSCGARERARIKHDRGVSDAARIPPGLSIGRT